MTTFNNGSKLIIGLTGARNVGKTTVADMMIGLGFIKRHTFNSGKAMCKVYYIYRGAPEDVAERMINGDLKDVPSPYLPGNATSRLFMEKVGKFMPSVMGVEWTMGSELLLTEQEQANCVFESVVYEADYFVKQGGIIIRVVRPDAKRVEGVETDAAQAQVKEHYRLVNDGNKEQLFRNLVTLMHEIVTRRNMDNMLKDYIQN